ncbi:TPA: hypothetical protein ACGEGE_004450 [Yersinia enterocolitica]|nr:hypothetical protein [Yersinia enterocolitica]HEF7236935.1 hypothetical protein [Yersinia enterocolitica]
MNNIEELFIANAELAAELLQHMADNEIDSDYFAVVTDSPNCGREVQSEHSVTEVALMAAGIIEQLIAQLEASQKELFDFHNQEFQQRLANAEHQLYMKDLAIHNIKASRKAQFRKRLAAEAELSAANEKLSKPVVLPPRRSASYFVDKEFSNEDLAAIYNAARLEFSVKVKNAGFTVEGE